MIKFTKEELFLIKQCCAEEIRGINSALSVCDISDEEDDRNFTRLNNRLQKLRNINEKINMHMKDE